MLKQPNKGVDIAKDKWNNILELFEDSQVPISVNSFLHHFWLSKYEYVTEKKLYKATKKQIKQNNAADFLDTLVDQAQYYRQLLEPSFKRWNKDDLDIRDSLVALNLFKVRQQIPMTLAVISSYGSGKLKSKHVKDIMAAIENFHFAFTAVTSQRSSGGISFMYALAARNLNNATGLPGRLEAIRNLKDKLRDKLPGRLEFEARFLEIRHSTKFTKQRDLVRYMLGAFLRYFGGGIPVDMDQMTIEHIGPENARKPLLDDEQTASIGNLIFVSKEVNGKLKNKPFAEKKAILLAAHVPLDDALKQATEWGPDEVFRRGQLLSNLALSKLWKL